MASGSALWAVQVAVRDALIADDDLRDLLGGTDADTRVHDHPVKIENQPMPFILVGESSSRPDDTMGRYRRKVISRLTIWSRYLGAAEITGIIGQITALLDNVALTVSGWEHVHTTFLRDAVEYVDGTLRRGTLEFEIDVTKAVS